MENEQLIDLNALLSQRNNPKTPTTIIKVTDADKGTFVEQKVPLQLSGLVQDPSLLPYPRDVYGNITISEGKAVPFMEATAARGRAMTSNFPDVLRDGIEFDAMSSYAGVPLIWRLLTGGEMPSNVQQEEYLKDASMGIAPVVSEGGEYKEAAIDLDDGVIIKNNKYGFKFPVTEEMRRFDKLGKVRDIAQQAGIALALTEEYEVIAALTTTANYTRSLAAGDTDEATGSGLNYQDLTLNALGLETAMNLLGTMKDKNGVYLGVRPTIMWCAPKAVGAARRLIQTRTLVRVTNTSATEVDGTGEGPNPFFGIVDTIISSPYFGSGYQWGLIDNSRGALKFQRVDQARVRGPVYDEGTDTYWFYPRTWFGFGIKDDRFLFFSTSTTRPTVS